MRHNRVLLADMTPEARKRLVVQALSAALGRASKGTPTTPRTR